jgi:hypothetical protein
MTFIYFIVALAMAGVQLLAAETHADQYSAEIRQTGEHPGAPASLSCSDEMAQLCRGKIEVLSGGRSVSISVVAFFERGDAFFRFRAGNTDLLAGTGPYVHLALSDLSVRRITVDLSVPTAAIREDGLNRLHRPVLRIVPAVATIQIEVQPGR